MKKSNPKQTNEKFADFMKAKLKKESVMEEKSKNKKKKKKDSILREKRMSEEKKPIFLIKSKTY